jgi:hypothetical protein
LEDSVKTALLTGLAAFALGATCATALTGTGSAASVATPVATRAPVDDSCSGPAAAGPSCVVERVLTLATASPSATPTPTPSRAGAAVADDDGTPDQGRGDRPAAVGTTAPAAPTAPAVKLRGDGTVDDSQPGVAPTAGDDDGTPDQGRGDRPGRASSDDDRDDDGDDRSGRRGGEDRSGSSHDDRHDDDDDDHDDDRHGDDHDDSGDDDGTADQGSGDR